MGARIYSTFVKTESSDSFKLKDIANNLFKTEDLELNKNDDSRSENLTIGILNSGILLSNYYLNVEVMVNHNTNVINALYQFFDQPEYIVAFMISDFNNAAGYTVIQNGTIIRSRYFDPQDEVVDSHDFGDPFPEEKDKILEIENMDSFDASKGMSYTKMYYTGKNEYYHFVDVGMVEIITKKILKFGAYWGPDNITYHLIKLDKTIKEIFS